MDLQDRLNLLIQTTKLSPTDLERESGIDRMRWSNIKRRSVRAGAPEIEAVAKIWPQYAYWLTTGNTIPEAGQISPDMEQVEERKVVNGTP